MKQNTGLRRELGLLEVTFSGVGVILGAGIYALLGSAAGLAGNSVWLAFVISATIAGFTGLSYAELSSMYPLAAAEYEYVTHSIGARTAFVIGWLIITSGVLAATTISLGFAGYFSGLTGFPVLASAFLLIALLAALLVYGIKTTALFAIVFTLVEAAGIVFIIIIGLPYLGSVNYLEMPNGWEGLFQAATLVFFAYIGFEGIVKLSEETREPEKTIPDGLLLALVISIVLYILVSISAVSVLSWQQIAASPAPFADVAFLAFGGGSYVILALIALFATANSVLLSLLASSRIAYGMAASGSLPAILARVSPLTGTPWIAVIATAIAAMAFLSIGSIEFVANATNFTIFLTFIAINLAVILLRYRAPETKRPFRIPISVGKMPLLPLLGILLIAFLILQLEPPVILAGLAITATGVLIIAIVEYRKMRTQVY